MTATRTAQPINVEKAMRIFLALGDPWTLAEANEITWYIVSDKSTGTEELCGQGYEEPFATNHTSTSWL